jgi:hypothetical protein
VRRKTPAERAWAKIEQTDTCWNWTGYVGSRDGYAQIWIGPGTRKAQAHRFVYELLVGPIPEGMQLDHLCRVRHCVNPEHLEPVTQQENVRRGMKGRMVTHCLQGHPYDDANTYIKSNGCRYCRACGAG